MIEEYIEITILNCPLNALLVINSLAQCDRVIEDRFGKVDSANT